MQHGLDLPLRAFCPRLTEVKFAFFPLTGTGLLVVVTLLHAMRELDQRAREIFEAARKLPPKARAACLDQVCGGDDPLRQRIVDALFQGQEDAACEGAMCPP